LAKAAEEETTFVKNDTFAGLVKKHIA